MRRLENQCVGCPSCSSHCKRNAVDRYICDECDRPIEGDRYLSPDGKKDLCFECLLSIHSIKCEECDRPITDEDAFKDGKIILCAECLGKKYKS